MKVKINKHHVCMHVDACILIYLQVISIFVPTGGCPWSSILVILRVCVYLQFIHCEVFVLLSVIEI